MKLLCSTVILLLASTNTFVKAQWTNQRNLTVVEANQYLDNHTQLFKPARIINVGDGIYCAFGYSISNMIMVEGTTGILIIDTLESTDWATIVYKEFRKITSKPLMGIIVTHFHRDHFEGNNPLLEDAKNNGWSVNVYAHISTAKLVVENEFRQPIRGLRGARQFGGILSDQDKTNDGLGIDYKQSSKLVSARLDVTHTYNERATFTVAGITFELVHTPGETEDQTTVWIPSKRAVFPGDNIYQAFPNLYAIRGSPYRNVKHWYESLDITRNLGAEYMIPSHTLPVLGKENIFNILTSYRDAVKFVYDQTFRYMNLFYEPDEIVEKVRLPQSLEKHPYLLEFYGSLDWSVRCVYNGHLGWFDADPANLNPLTKKQRAKRLLSLISFATMLEEARKSMDLSKENLQSRGFHLNTELQWALELSKMILDANPSTSNELENATLIYREALRARASSTLSAVGRNYYLACAVESERGIARISPRNNQRNIFREIRSEVGFMMDYPLSFKAEFCDNRQPMSFLFNFTDSGNVYKYTIRNCVVDLEINPNQQGEYFDLKATMKFALWRDIVVGDTYILSLDDKAEIKLEGQGSRWKDVLYLHKILHLMDRSGFLNNA
uniref:alkyl/aryl-sulfatase BDS1-like n=1 Tax=Ciona intestinalis TaxID=7719 RepID=UPI000180C8A7|nr:alkyl/aryl-sulfatase BDS1-like [Ciona intestinalis]|eukprot:XP_002120502.1 alkyl/aryl-sulfatase BDS1-like [Ciona intestinalis]